MSSPTSTPAKKETKPTPFGSNAGEIAANLFDKFKKRNSTASSTSSSESSSSQQPLTASSLLTNLAISFHKNVVNHQQNANNTSSNKQPASNLVIIDDDNYDDDDELKVEANLNKKQSLPPPTHQLPVSQSDFSIKKSNETTAKIPISSSLNNSILKSASEDAKSTTSDTSATSKLSASSSLHKISSVLDELRHSDLANTASAEADSLRNRFFPKKKSIELSIETKNSPKTTSSPPSLVSSSSTSSMSRVESKEKIMALSSIRSASVDEESSDNAARPKQIEPSPKSVNLETISAAETSTASRTNSKLSKSLNSSVKDCVQQAVERHRSKLIGFGVLLSIFVYNLSVPSKLFVMSLSYGFGFTSGVLLCILVVYLANKFDLVKYVVKLNDDNGKVVSESSSQPSADQSVEQIQTLLIQTATVKENKNFDGVYKVGFIFFDRFIWTLISFLAKLISLCQKNLFNKIYAKNFI